MSSKLSGESFGQKRPPLYEMIRNILRDYPSGQIFKVRSSHNIILATIHISVIYKLVHDLNNLAMLIIVGDYFSLLVAFSCLHYLLLLSVMCGLKE